MRTTIITPIMPNHTPALKIPPTTWQLPKEIAIKKHKGIRLFNLNLFIIILFLKSKQFDKEFLSDSLSKYYARKINLFFLKRIKNAKRHMLFCENLMHEKIHKILPILGKLLLNFSKYTPQ